MSRRNLLSWCVVLGIVLIAAAPAGAVIKLDITIAKVFETSKTVLVGKVASVDAQTRVIHVDNIEALRGPSPGDKLRVQVVSPPELVQGIVPGQPLVMVIQAKGGQAAIHLADTWLLASGVPNSNLQVWRVVQVFDTLKQAFPGRTVALVRLVADLKAGERTLVDRWDRKVFPGGVHKRATLSVQKPSWLLSGDVNGDTKPDLLVGSGGGTRLMLATANGYEDVTAQWGAWGAAGDYRAFGDVNGDGRIDLLLNDTLWINDGKKFTADKSRLELSGKTRPLAAALADTTGDGKSDALLLSADGQLLIFENPGSTAKPWPSRPAKRLWKDASSPVYAAFGDWGDNGKLHVMTVSEMGIFRYPVDTADGLPADILRLTGVDLGKNNKYRNGLKNVLALALDMDGDRRPDLYSVCDAGGVLLINRGFGAFLLDDAAGGPVTSQGEHQVPFHLTPATVWTGADLHGHGAEDLLVLTDNGVLYEVDNGPK